MPDVASRRRLHVDGAWPPLVALVVGTALAATGSWHVSFWTDESITISASGRSWSELSSLLTSVDAVHGAYYAFMKAWTSVFGASELSLRFPSALSVGGTGAGLLVLGRRMLSPATAVLAAGLCVALPRLAWAGVEGRSFAASALLATWATWALVVAAEDPHVLRWIRYVLLSAVGVLLNIYVVLLVVAHGIALLVLRRRQDPRVLAWFVGSGAAVAVLTMPVLLLVRSQQGQLGTGGDRSPAYIARRVLVNQFFLGETPRDGVYGRLFDVWWQGAGLLAAAIGIGLAGLGVLRAARHGDDRSLVLPLVLPWVLVPTGVVAAYALLVAPIYQPRYLTFAAPAVALLVAIGLRGLPARAAVPLGAVFALAVVSVGVSQRLEYSKAGQDWAEASAVVSRCATAGDAVLFEPRSLDGSDTRTTRRIAVAYPDAFAGLDDLTLRRSGAETGTLDGESVPASQAVGLDGTSRVWVLRGLTTPSDVVDRDAAVLQTAGFAPVGTWVGPHTTVEEYTRDGAAGRLAAGCG